MSLAGDDDEPRTELDIGVKISSVAGEPRALVGVGGEPSPADDEPQTMEPRTLDPRLGIRPLAVPPPRPPAVVPEAEPDVDDEPSIQTVEARVVDAHKGVVEKIKKSPTIRGVGPLVPAEGDTATGGDDEDEPEGETEDETEDRTELDARGRISVKLAHADEAPTVKALPKVADPPPAAEDEEDVTALDTSLLSGGLALAATAARAEASKPAAAKAPAVSPKAAAAPTPVAPPKAIPSVPPRPAPRVSKTAPDPVNRTLEMPRPAFVNAPTQPPDSTPRGPKGTAKIMSGAYAATPAAHEEGSSPVDTRSSRGQGHGGPSTFTVTLLVAAAFVIGVLVTLFVVNRTPPSASDVAPTAETASPPTEPPATSSTHKTPASFTSPTLRAPPKTPPPKSSTPLHL